MRAIRHCTAVVLTCLLLGLGSPVGAQNIEKKIRDSHDLSPLGFPAGDAEDEFRARLAKEGLDGSRRKSGLTNEQLESLRRHPDLLLDLLKKNGMPEDQLELIRKNPSLLNQALERMKHGEDLRDPGTAPSGPAAAATPQFEPGTPRKKKGVSAPGPTPAGAETGSQDHTNQNAQGQQSAVPPVPDKGGLENSDGQAAPRPSLPFGKRFLELAERLQQMNPGLRESPALSQSLTSLSKSVDQEDPKWKSLSEAARSWNERWSEWRNTPAMQNLMPHADRFTPGSFSLEKAPRISLPRLSNTFTQESGMSEWGGGLSTPSGQAFGALAWVLGLTAGGYCLWRLWLRAQWQKLAARAKSRLGPWPVDPTRVHTREQLIQAYEYLALTQLGLMVRSWNHLAIAKGLGDPADQSQQNAALALGNAYEHARYAPVEEALPPDVYAEARRCLSLLAGVTRP
jgi:hypothetical protein